MARASRKLMTAFAAAPLALALAACGGSTTSAESSAPAPAASAAGSQAQATPGSAGASGGGSAQGKSVCYITAASAHPYVTPANQAVEAAASAAGVELTEVSQEFDVQKGTSQLDTCIGKGVNGIILWPLDPEAYTSGLRRAKDAGIPVVVMNSPVGADALSLTQSFEGPDPTETGRLGAELLNNALGGKGNIVVISGQAGNGSSIDTEKGFYDRLKELGSSIKVLQTVYADFDQQKSLVASRDLITRFGEQIDAAYTIDDGMAHGFVDAWAESGLSKTPVVTGVNGQKDAFELIRQGKMVGTILQSPTDDGRQAMETMVSVLDGQTVPTRVPLPLPVVTKDNIDQYQPSF
jgi:ribose transport system substrate-binding protein